MQYKLSASTLPPNHISILLPASKSISNRAMILHALANGKMLPHNLSDCDDTRVMINALNSDDELIDIMAAGTSMRFLTAYYSVTPGTHVLTGTQRMQQRPIKLLVDALRTLGAHIEYVGNEGFPPLRITGTHLTGGVLTLAGNVSSQFISALLMIAPCTRQGLTLQLTGEIISRPYIELTLQMMKQFGVAATWLSPDRINVPHGSYCDIPFAVESDWSAASYWYEIAALSNNTTLTVELPGLLKESGQGDSRGAQLFGKLGVQTLYTPQGVRLTKQEVCVKSLDENLVEMPDLAQTFVVTCCLLGIPFRFGGLQSLRIKETDRISALITEMNKLGYVLHAEGDHTLLWNGERCPANPSPVIHTYEDHRMAMAFAPAALRTDLSIAEPAVVSKSYPRYWDDIKTIIHYEQE